MPAYPYICQQCGMRFQKRLSYEEYEQAEVRCPECNSADLQRRIGRVRTARSTESRMDALADPASLEGLEENPKALARAMREMSGEMGEDLGPDFDEVVDRLEAGQSPEDIESDLPDLGGADDFGPEF